MVVTVEKDVLVLSSVFSEGAIVELLSVVTEQSSQVVEEEAVLGKVVPLEGDWLEDCSVVASE